MAKIPKGRLAEGPYKPICRDCAIYFSITAMPSHNRSLGLAQPLTFVCQVFKAKGPALNIYIYSDEYLFWSLRKPSKKKLYIFGLVFPKCFEASIRLDDIEIWRNCSHKSYGWIYHALGGPFCCIDYIKYFILVNSSYFTTMSKPYTRSQWKVKIHHRTQPPKIRKRWLFDCSWVR